MLIPNLVASDSLALPRAEAGSPAVQAGVVRPRSARRWALSCSAVVLTAWAVGCGSPGTETTRRPSGGSTAPVTGGNSSSTDPTGGGSAPGASNTGQAPGPTSQGGAPTSGDTGVVIDSPGQVIGQPSGAMPTTSGELIGGVVCNSADVSFEKEVPTVLILVDKSTSMFASNLPNGGSPAFGTKSDRWEAMRDAVAALEPFSGEVAFSLSTYTSFNMSGSTCPSLENLDVAPATTLDVPTRFADILASIPPSAEAIPDSKSETPTGAAILAASAALQALPSKGPKYILVITDGDPDTCVNFDPQCGQDIAIGAAQEAFAAGIKTFVVGISDDVDNNFLNDLAHAGQGEPVAPPAQEDLFCIQKEPKEGTTFDYNDWRPSAHGDYGADGMTYAEELFYKPTDVDSFTEQVRLVVNGVRSCEFEMQEAVVRAQAGKGGVRLDLSSGTALTLMYDDPNGWSLAADNDFTVVLNGTACEQLKTDSEPRVKIEFPCEVRIPRVL